MESFTRTTRGLSTHKVCATIIVLLSIFEMSLATRVDPWLSSSTEFIKNSCGATRYPEVCYQTLSSYASTIQTSPTEMASTALSVTLKSSRSVSGAVTKMSQRNDLGHRDLGAIADCVEVIGDSVDELRKSMVAMKELEGPEFEFQISNIQTWVSAALTDQDTCMDGFEGKGFNGKVKKTIRRHIVRVAQLTSNALALINRLR